MTKFLLLPINKQDTNILKGMGILLIMLHNFLHWVDPSTGENEFDFSTSRVVTLVKGIINTPSESINLFFDFFGPYGVALFFFISAYGLTISYNKNSNNSYKSFVKNRFLKLYPAYISSVFLLIIWFVVRNEHFSINIFRSIAYKLLLISNFIKDEPLALNGPWWFLVAIMQFYFVFPLLVKGHKRYGNRFLWLVVSVGFAIRMVYVYVGGKLIDFVPYSFIPYIFELTLGIYLASIKEIKLSKCKLRLIAILSLLVFCAGNYVQEIWFFASVSFLIVFLYSYSSIKTILQYLPPINNFFIYFGSISYYLFLIHGPLRVPLIYYAHYATPYGKIGYAFVFLVLSIIFAHSLKFMEQKTLNYWNTRNLKKNH
jgi:peptidoglycan/LPS O-acetylase OafA/YrhL